MLTISSYFNSVYVILNDMYYIFGPSMITDVMEYVTGRLITQRVRLFDQFVIEMP